ncbi:MAG: YlxR family protein [Clostridiales bacterium]|nr:YlxR family protein [Clostridiales bacterium]
MAEKRLPVRTCIACRKEFNKPDLLRIVKTKDGEFLVDKTGKANGRGAYICTSENCVKKLKKVKLLDKIFSTPVPDEIYIRIEEELLGKK